MWSQGVRARKVGGGYQVRWRWDLDVGGVGVALGCK